MKLGFLSVCFFYFATIAPMVAQTSVQVPGSQSAIDAYHMEQPKLSAFDQDLLNTQKVFLDAMKRGDTAYVSNAIANNFVGIAPNGDSAGKGELVEYAVAHKEAKAAPMFYDFQVVQLADNAAVVTYNVVLPTHIERYQHLSDTWVRENGQWKLKFQQTTLNLWSAHDL
jgi:hypothetical protein